MATKATLGTQIQPNDKPMSNTAKSSGIIPLNSLHTGQFTWPLIFLSLLTVPPSLVALVVPSCDEGALRVKLWAFEYQLTKKGNCKSSPELT